MGKKRCTICGQKHHKNKRYEFPDGFPNKWKLCCTCLWLCKAIIDNGLEFVIGTYEVYYHGFRRFFKIRRVKKVNRLISLGKW